MQEETAERIRSLEEELIIHISHMPIKGFKFDSMSALLNSLAQNSTPGTPALIMNHNDATRGLINPSQTQFPVAYSFLTPEFEDGKFNDLIYMDREGHGLDRLRLHDADNRYKVIGYQAITTQGITMLVPMQETKRQPFKLDMLTLNKDAKLGLAVNSNELRKIYDLISNPS